MSGIYQVYTMIINFLGFPDDSLRTNLELKLERLELNLKLASELASDSLSRLRPLSHGADRDFNLKFCTQAPGGGPPADFKFSAPPAGGPSLSLVACAVCSSTRLGDTVPVTGRAAVAAVAAAQVLQVDLRLFIREKPSLALRGSAWLHWES